MREAGRAQYSAEIAVDHITDHLPFRSTRKQWTGEWRRARFSRRKGAEKAIFSGNCLHRSVWDHQAAGSIPVTRTKSPPESFDPGGLFFDCRGSYFERQTRYHHGLYQLAGRQIFLFFQELYCRLVFFTPFLCLFVNRIQP